MILAPALAALIALAGQPADIDPHKQTPVTTLPSEGQVTAIPLPANSPLIFENVLQDWGRISDEKPVTHDFRFTNRSNRTVTIVEVKASCGCTGVTADKTIAPGASGKITATFNPAGRHGREIKTINVTLDDPNCPLIQLTTAAEVLKRIVVEPGSVGFGEIPYSKGGIQEFTIYGRAPGFDVTDAKIQDPKFKVELIGKDIVEASGDRLPRARFRVLLNPDAPIGVHNSTVTLTTTDPNQPLYNVPVFAVVAGNIRLSPDRFFVRLDGSIAPFVSDVTISSPTGKPFEILSIDVDTGDALHAVVDLTPNDSTSKASYRLRLAGTTPASIGEVKGAVRLRTTDPDQGEIIVPLMAMWMSKPPAAPAGPAMAPATLPPKQH